jgi:serine-type D-Ala-D-Ala carboxypeptidase/endopeptidase (penicillin-binding protein 4)
LLTSYPDSPKQFFLDREPGSFGLTVWGQVPLDTNEDEDTLSLANPPDLAGRLFEQALERQGVKVQGRVRVLEQTPSEDYRRRNSDTQVPAPLFHPRAVKLAGIRSPPLAQDIKVILKVSQNLHAEMLLRALGREAHSEGTPSAGLRVVEDLAARAGIAPDEAHFTDGSGLSRMNLVEPAALVRLLEYMSRSQNFGVYLDALPVAGVDGTLDHRFLTSPARGHIHTKSGGLTHVHTLSGYMDLPSRERLAFSIMTDNQPLEAGQAAAVIDAIAGAIYEEFRRTR